MTSCRPETRGAYRAAAVLCLLLAGTGCGREDRTLSVTHVLTHGHCRAIDAGVTRIDYAELARIRGSRLLQMTGPDAPAGPAGTGPSGDPDATGQMLLLAISRGEQPTAGYGFTLRDSSRHGSEGLIEVEWYEPSADSVQAQVITHPCLVVGVGRADLESIRVEDQHGARVGAVELVRQDPAR